MDNPLVVSAPKPLDARQIILGSHVSTDLGEGFVFGRSLAVDLEMFDVRLFDGTLCTSYPNRSKRPVVTKVTLIEKRPIDHPKLPAGFKALWQRL